MLFDPTQLDPSKLDPRKMMELSQLFQSLPPSQMGRLQTLMHNMMAGFDVKKDMEAFEKELPPGFKEKVMSVLGPQAFSMDALNRSHSEPPVDVSLGVQPDQNIPKSIQEARLTILRAVAEGHMTPEQAEPLLFPT